MRKTRPIAPIMLAVAACAWCAGLRAQESPEAIKNARKRFAEGVAAMDLQKYEEARVAFAQAYALKPHASVLRNLAQAELRTGHYLEAARHLASFLRDTSFGSAEERDAANRALLEAEAKVGKIAVEVDVGGAEIMLDGEVVGRSAVDGTVYGEPGKRTLCLKKDGYVDYESVQMLEAGGAVTVRVTMQKVDAAPAGAPPRAAASAATSGPQKTKSPERPAESSSPSRVEPVIVVAGTTIAVAGLAAGIGLRLTAAGKASDADAIFAATPGGSVCGAGTPYADACAAAHGLNDDAARQRNLSTTGFVVGGVAAAATLAYVLWPRRGGSAGASGAPAQSTSPTVRVVPVVSMSGAGAVVDARF